MAKHESIVQTRSSGVRTVPAEKILNSQAGREGLQKARELFERVGKQQASGTGRVNGARSGS